MFVGWHGEPCAKCKGPVKRTATHWGLCSQHWHGATESERAIARFNTIWDEREEKAVAFQIYYEQRMVEQLRADLDAYGQLPA
jgi:hypothetical protein